MSNGNLSRVFQKMWLQDGDANPGFASPLLSSKRQVSGEISCERHVRPRWQMTPRDPRFVRVRADATTYRFGVGSPRSFSLSLPLPGPSSTHNNCFSSLSSAIAGPTLFVRARRFRSTDFSDSVESSFVCSTPPHKNRNRNRMPEAPTGVSSGSRNEPRCTLEHPSSISFVFQAGWNRIET